MTAKAQLSCSGGLLGEPGKLNPYRQDARFTAKSKRSADASRLVGTHLFVRKRALY